ncbi:hypothetical protein KOR42_07030 [Thalassoglobus neptunius]|uniref:Uncharacterized protein n=1 Tax=Thalassoglobus neptunius TaxID=1938619 RepID=A0A5C5X526_9PLAN|nr:hypothetical protein [Thalassoglobus neptunius]TWT57343.1 hypothetical protein KOR42_07030 [Thalassoglobus neptunius]
MARNSNFSLLSNGLSWKSTQYRTAIAVTFVLFSGTFCPELRGESISLKESYLSEHAFSCQAQIQTVGSVVTAKSQTEKDRLPLKAEAGFQFLEKLLPPAGRDAFALRSLRIFSRADLVTDVNDYRTESTLPADTRKIVAAGRREGVQNYPLSGNLTRDSLDLLELPGDPLAVIGLLPETDQEIGDSWTPPDWAIQMLTGIEAVKTSDFECKLSEANRISAKISLSGTVEGERLGAKTKVEVKGTVIYDRRTSHVAQTRVIYVILADIGTVNPGMDVKVTSNLVRKVASSQDEITPELLQSIGFEPDPSQLKLTFTVPEWGLQLSHLRDWHLFQTVASGSNPVSILRLVEHGSLVSQCNVSPLPPAAPGERIPLEQFENDIQSSLGDKFQEFGEREEIETGDDRKIYRVVANGQYEVKGASASAQIPMSWIYYLVVNPQGRQFSFVFSIEPTLLEQLESKDLDLVQSLRFTQPLSPTPR